MVRNYLENAHFFKELKTLFESSQPAAFFFRLRAVGWLARFPHQVGGGARRKGPGETLLGSAACSILFLLEREEQESVALERVVSGRSTGS